MDNWLQLSCPFCRTPFQIKEAHAHLRGRCPSCGFRIEPIKPKPPQLTPQVSQSNEPLGLVPLEEEWPEPPRLIAWDDRPHYAVASPPPAPPIGFAPEEKAPAAKPQAAAPAPVASFAPPGARPQATAPAKVEVDILGEPVVRPTVPPTKAPPAAKPAATPPRQPVVPSSDPAAEAPSAKPQAAETIYRMAESDLPAPEKPSGQPTPYRRSDIDFDVPPTPPVPPPMPPPIEPHSPYQLSTAELEPERPPPVPLHLFWTGVWNFAFRVGNLKPLFWLTLGFTMMGGQIALIIQLYAMELQVASFAAFLVGIGVLFMLILTGSYASTCFLTILQDTANAADEIQYPDHDWRFGVFSLLRLAWLTFLGLVLPAMVFSALGCFGYGLFILLTPALFSFCLLSALARDSWIMIFDSQVMGGLRRRPDVIPIVYVYSLVLLLVCVGLAVPALIVPWYLQAFLIPLTAFVFAACWLTFARVLGRVGYAITEDPKKKRRKKRKKKRKAKEAAEEDDEDVPEVTPEASPAEPPL